MVSYFDYARDFSTLRKPPRPRNRIGQVIEFFNNKIINYPQKFQGLVIGMEYYSKEFDDVGDDIGWKYKILVNRTNNPRLRHQLPYVIYVINKV